jgi:hypothetical protein
VPGNGGGRRRLHRHTGLDTERPADPNSKQEQDELTPRHSAPVGELVAAWVSAKLAEVDDLVDEARSRVDAIPNQRVLWSLVGEVIVLLRALELEVAELRKAVRR